MAQDPQLILEAALATAPDAIQPSWTDITGRILWSEGGLEVETGRQTEFADLDPSKLSGSLRNNDGALTPNNASAPPPYAGNWELGKRIRLVERFLVPELADSFDRTVAAGGLGSSPGGVTYSLIGTASDFSVSGSAAVLALPAAGDSRSFIPSLTALADVELRATVDLAVTPTGAGVTVAQLTTRYTGAGYLSGGVRVQPSSAVSLALARDGGTTLATGTTAWTHTPGVPIHVVVRQLGAELALKVWRDDQAEPAVWDLTWTDSTAFALPSGPVVFQAIRPASNTNSGLTVRWLDVEARELFPLFTGHLELPSVKVVLPDIYQPCAFSAIDRLGRISSLTPLAGTLAEYIALQQADRLVLHVPLSDPSGPWMARDRPETTRLTARGFLDDPVPKEPGELITAASTEGPPGDDQSYATWEPVFDAEGDAYLGSAFLTLPIEVNVTASQVLAVSCWWKPKSEDTTNPQVLPQMWRLLSDQDALDDGAAAQLSVLAYDSGLRRTRGTVLDEADSVSLEEDGIAWDEWRLITLRIDLATKAINFWIGNTTQMSTTGSGLTAPSGWRFRSVRIGESMNGSIAHLQIRVGDSSTMLLSQHLAQHKHGMTGWEGQTVAERITALAPYAGIPAGAVTVDPAASAPLQAVSMAGKTAADLMQEAARAGQDLLLTEPSGQVVLVPRQRRYGQAVTLSIPWGWLSAKSMTYRPEPPLSDVTVSRTGGGSVTRRNTTASDRYTVRSQSIALDTAVEADPANLAAWLLKAYDRMRTRVPALRINMLNRTVAQRQQLLRLRIGDRIQLTGMPAGSPSDVPDLIIQGIKHTVGQNQRVIEFNTSPLLGPSAGQPPACAMVGTAVVGSSTRIAY